MIGLISDTHDNVKSIEKAVEKFNEEGVEYVLHAGDHIAPFTLKWFKELKAEMIGVSGNLDAEFTTLSEKYAEKGWKIYKGFAEVDLGGRIALIHGVSEEIIDALALSGKYRVVVRGHTHRVQKELRRNTLIVNPGEACGYLSGKATIAVLEMPEVKVRFIEL